jgi:hypothetical protein
MILLANHGAQGLYMYVSGRSIVTSFFLDLQHCRTTKFKYERTHTKRERSERDGKEIHPTTKEVDIEQIKAAKEAYENASTSGQAKEGPNEQSNQWVASPQRRFRHGVCWKATGGKAAARAAGKKTNPGRE